jgi:hypothetical protein
MQTLTINIANDTLVDKVMWLLEHFKNDGLEIVSKEDIEDLKLLKDTREEETISFEEYLKNEN